MIINLTYYFIIILIISLLLDLLIGELPSYIHPVVIIGKFIDFFTNLFKSYSSKLAGVYLTLGTLTLSTLILIIIYYILIRLNLLFNSILSNFILIFLLSLILSSLYSVNMLVNATLSIKNDLDESLDKARKSMSYLVSRNTNDLSEDFIISASIETMTENITDSYVSSIFYYFLFIFIGSFFNLNMYSLLFLGIFGVLLQRVVNTLDAMVGYKNNELKYIGWFPAHLDDILNYIPARFSGFMVVISSLFLKLDFVNSFKVFKRDSNSTPSPNSGFTMAAVAGALDIQLIKKDTYVLGDNIKNISKNDIIVAIKLTCVSIVLSTLVLVLVFLILSSLFV